jgi:hypothetical protein
MMRKFIIIWLRFVSLFSFFIKHVSLGYCRHFSRGASLDTAYLGEVSGEPSAAVSEACYKTRCSSIGGVAIS